MRARPSARRKNISCSELILVSWAGEALVPSGSADPPTFRISETNSASALASRHPSSTAKKCSQKVQIKFLCRKEVQAKLCFSCHFVISSGAFKPQIRSSGHVPGISLEFIYSPKLLIMSIFKNTETWAGSKILGHGQESIKISLCPCRPAATQPRQYLFLAQLSCLAERFRCWSSVRSV